MVELGNCGWRYPAKIMTPVLEWIGQLDIEGVSQHQNSEGVEDKKRQGICDEDDQLALCCLGGVGAWVLVPMTRDPGHLGEKIPKGRGPPRGGLDAAPPDAIPQSAFSQYPSDSSAAPVTRPHP